MAATAAALLWQSATVHFNYGGNWTALFCIGAKSPMPPELETDTWIFPESTGYDGQYYRIAARDPWMQLGLWRFVDSPSRYQRILLPAAAWLSALGQPRWIDRSYILLVLVFVFVGTWFTAMWAILQNRSVWWGLGFVLLPGTLITLNRMTVDVTEYACLTAGLYFWRRDLWIGSWIAGAAAFLARDLGLILIAAMVGMCLLQRSWGRAAIFTAAALPAFVWDLHVGHTIAISQSAALIPPWAFHARLIGPLLRYYPSAKLSDRRVDQGRYPVVRPALYSRGYRSRVRGGHAGKAASLHARSIAVRALRRSVRSGKWTRFLGGSFLLPARLLAADRLDCLAGCYSGRCMAIPSLAGCAAESGVAIWTPGSRCHPSGAAVTRRFKSRSAIECRSYEAERLPSRRATR